MISLAQTLLKSQEFQLVMSVFSFKDGLSLCWYEKVYEVWLLWVAEIGTQRKEKALNY